MSKKATELYEQWRKRLEERIPRLIDKYSVIKRLFMIGMAFNVYLLYRNVIRWLTQMKKYGVLKDAEQYIQRRRNEFSRVHDLERQRIL